MDKPRTTSTRPVCLKVMGLITSESYQKCKIFTQKLHKHHDKHFKEPLIKGFLEMDWVKHLNNLRKEIGGPAWEITKGAVVFIDDEFLGGEEELFSRYSLYQYEPPTLEQIEEISKQEYTSYLNRNNLLYVYLELTLDGEYTGTLLFQLQSDLLPESCSWFSLLCNPENRQGYSYKGSRIHRVCKNGWFQAGIVESHHSGKYLADESYYYKHDQRGVLSFANEGKNTNFTQFFVIFKPSEWMDGRYVAFGRLVEGSDVLRRIENTRCTYESPDNDIRIANCGVVEAGLGRTLHRVDKLKMKGITIGEPHMKLETFADLVFEQFSYILFERLDSEVKNKIHGDWIAEVLWGRILPQITARVPVDDVFYEKDRSSAVLLTTRYLAGLYGLQDIPDHFIKDLLVQIINDAVEQSDTNDMAESIVRFILNTVEKSGRTLLSSTNVAEDLLNNLIANVERLLFGSSGEIQLGKGSELVLTPRSLTEIISKVMDLSEQQSKSQISSKKVQFPKESDSILLTGQDGSLTEDAFSSKDSIVGYIWETLLNSLQTLKKTKSNEI